MPKEKPGISPLPEGYLTLGPCCVCDRTDRVTVAIFLDGLAPVPGTGWGCIVCDLPPDGAIAVACEACASQIEAGVATPRYICKGYPTSQVRIPFAHLRGSHRHDLTRHMCADGGF